jgi:EmrB/QacA subfamily drug resistance transporter
VPFSGPDKRQKVLVLLTMCFALFMAMLDNTVVNVALPTISGELGAGVSGLQWIVDGYVLAFASFLLTGGIVGDRYGRKKTFIAGLVVFTIASLLCGLADTTGQLVAFRFLQGIGAALLMPGTLAIITATFPPYERAQAIGIWAGVSGIALALGPTAGGWLVENTGWESVFFLNVPIGLLGVAAAVRFVQENKDPNPRRLDIPGLLLGSGALVAVTFGLIEANEKGWSDPTIVASLVAGAVLLVGFILFERRTTSPMMPLSLYRIPAFAAGNLVGFSISFAMFGTFFFSSLYFQVIRGYSAFEAGVRQLPITAMIVLIAPQAGRVAQKIGSRAPLTFGLTMAGSGLLLLSLVGADTPYPFVAGALMTMGVGMACTMTPMTAAVMASVGVERAGLGSAMTNTSREVGGVFGVALLGTLLTTRLKGTMSERLAGIEIPEPLRKGILEAAGHGRLGTEAGGGVGSPAAEQIRQAFSDSFMNGFSMALAMAGAIVLVIAVVANRYIPGKTMVEERVPTMASKPTPVGVEQA